ncbi:MAG TPA: hypothetical protein VGT05_03870 [Patescibacteria group bacterium]|nr:hypothetical protein [Patescibacteria group bacterium]
MKKLFFLLFLLWFSLSFASQAFAIENPLSSPNNKVGIHILFTSELDDAAKLVNSNGGDWGYVTIPIQAGDKDLEKWQAFMDTCRSLHLIPIIRLATEGDYFNTQVWRKPDERDVLDFANFLNSLTWPTKNRYVIVFNEVNRGNEYGGTPSPSDYAQLLSYAVTVFKSRSPDFFIISAGLDNAAANTSETMNEYSFLQSMNSAVPGIFNQVDGLGSHSYPNPAFSQPPSIHTNESITSFLYERSFVSQFTSKTLPTFITETGWSDGAIDSTSIASYYQQAFSSVWNDPNVVAVTPFLLTAGAGPFADFSFLQPDGSPSAMYASLLSIPKIQGKPTVTQSVLSATVNDIHLPIERFALAPTPPAISSYITQSMKVVAKWLLGMY